MHQGRKQKLIVLLYEQIIVCLLRMRDQKDFVLCTFLLAFKEWVLTAAHCFCMRPLACKADSQGKTVIDFELSRVNVYLGKLRKKH